GKPHLGVRHVVSFRVTISITTHIWSKQCEKVRPLRIVDIDHRSRLLLGRTPEALREHSVGPRVFLHGLVVVEVALRKIREDLYVSLLALDAFLDEAVRGNLH